MLGYPFTSIVGQEELKLALLLAAIEPSVGGVLAWGERGTGKSTAVRALAGLLPPLWRVRGCAFNCDPADAGGLCADCRARPRAEGRLPRERAGVPVVDLPLGATEDRVCGTIDIERAVTSGVRAFEPGLLARANRGLLYIDEVNLLEDHLVDLLLDAAATGRHKVEREGVSAEHPARFVLVGSGNPEEGELRPQLLDRFGLFVEVRTTRDLDERVLVVERAEAFARDPEAFLRDAEAEQARLRRRLVRARGGVASVEVPRALVRKTAELCVRLGVDGHRGELTTTRAARALAAFEGRRAVTDADVRRVAPMSLRHRLRRDPLEQTSGGGRVEQALAELFGDDAATRGDGRKSGGGPGSENGGGRGRRESEPAGTFHPNGGTGARVGRNLRGERPGLEKPPVGDSAAGDSFKRRSLAGGARSDGHENPDGQTTRGEDLSAPPAAARLPEGLDGPADERAKGARLRAAKTPKGRGVRAGAGVEAGGGRYARAVAHRTRAARLALDATLRAAAPSQPARRALAPHDSAERVFHLTAADLRFKQFRRKAGTLFVVAVDTSGSMALNRIGQAKGALAHLLRRSYVRRDRVALVGFRERDAALLLAPSRSQARARRVLDALPVGGATPLSAGLLRALEVARRAARQGAPRIVLLVFTDARANVPLRFDEREDRAARARRIEDELARLGAALRKEGVTSVVVDTQNRFTSGGEVRQLAAALGGRCVRLTAQDGGRSLAESVMSDKQAVSR